MKTIVPFILFVFGVLFLIDCSDTTAGSGPPPPRVLLVEKSPDSAAVESGIDAEDPPVNFPDPEKNGILIQWHALDQENLAAYDIYRRAADTSGAFQKIDEVPQNFNLQDTTYIDTGVQLDTVYYYYVVARDEEGQEGEPSQKDHYRLLPKPFLLGPDGGQSFSGFFEWQFPPPGAQYFVFRLEKRIAGQIDYEPYFRAVHFVSNLSSRQHWTSSELGLPDLEAGDYRWRVEVIKLDDDGQVSDVRQGSEASWGRFRVP